jgi:hypothetical protein
MAPRTRGCARLTAPGEGKGANHEWISHNYEGGRCGRTLARQSAAERSRARAVYHAPARGGDAEATAGADPNLIVAALLHDTIEDQGVTREEIAAQFNDDVADLVVEVTDNKKLPKAERKQLQIKHAPKLTPRAKILKLADKISNLRSLAASPPADWPMQRRIDYVIWTKEVVQSLRGASGLLEQEFDRAAADAERTIPLVAIDGGLATGIAGIIE